MLVNVVKMVAIRDTIMRVLHPADLEGNLSEDAAMPEGVSLAEISAFINAIAEIKRADAVELAAQNGDLTVMVVGGGNTNAALPLPKQ
jgi:methyl coenzyme M reductase beta subunit